MSAEKRKADDEVEEPSKREKIEEEVGGVRDSEDNGNETQSTEQDNGRDDEGSRDSVASASGAGDDGEKKKFRLKGPEYSGTLLLCGGTNWDLIGRKELPKNAKGATGRNLYAPHRLNSLNGVRVSLVVSGNTSCHSVLVTEGRAMSWGRNDKGQLGLGDTNRRDVPTIIEDLKDFKIVDAACGRGHTLLLTERGTVFSCGDNKMGQCGVGNQHPVIHTPSRINFKGRPVTRMACGAEFSMILDSKGYIYSFGCPEYGQLGHNTDGKYFVKSNKLAYSCELIPKRILMFIEKTREGHVIPVEGVEVVDVACGTNHSICIDSRSRAYTWGFGGYGRLGHAEPKDEMIPRLIKYFDGPNRGVNRVWCGSTFTICVNAAGAIFLMGQTKRTGEANMYPKPVQDLQGWEIRSVGCGNTSIVVAAEESVISFGPSPTYGELGLGEMRKSSTRPVEVKCLEGIHVYHVACGMGHTMMIARDETDEEKKKLETFPEYTP